jgi:hypothetical protein
MVPVPFTIRSMFAMGIRDRAKIPILVRVHV